MKPYEHFLQTKSQYSVEHGFSPLWMPDFLFDFQQHLVEWALRKGRAGIFADCGLGKTLMQLVWAENIVRHTNQRILLLTPLAVGAQTLAEGQRFGIACVRSRDGLYAPQAKIVIANYEQLHKFDPSQFVAAVCDESSCIKHFGGATQKHLTRFMQKMPYRLLCTATAAPNDYIELGTSSEALGELGYSDMLSRFFKQSDNTSHRQEQIKQQRQEKLSQQRGNHYQKLAFRVSQTIGQWRLKGHAVMPFWRWVSSWARACRTPSDLGFSDKRFILPALTETSHCVKARQRADGLLFDLPAFGLAEERDERRRTMQERCEYAAQLVDHDHPAVVWCHLNAEGDLLSQLIQDGRQVRGADNDEAKEDAYQSFLAGALRVLIIKPKIGAWGMNWQHCAHVVTFASHSYEQYYQSVRRCWRFGQAKSVSVDIIATEGEARVKENMQRKARQADEMFSALVREMSHAQSIAREDFARNHTMEQPSWIK